MSCEEDRRALPKQLDQGPPEIIISPGLDFELGLMRSSDRALSSILITNELFHPGRDPHFIHDALQEVDFWYEGDSKFSDAPRILEPLRLAQTPPSETYDPTVTAIRLLCGIPTLEADTPIFSQGSSTTPVTGIPDFHQYGEAVQYGVNVLTRREQEPDSEFFYRIREADRRDPQLRLVPTQARRIIQSVLDPVGLPAEYARNSSAIEGKRTEVNAYKRSLRHLFGEPGQSPYDEWRIHTKSGIQIAERALTSFNLMIPTIRPRGT